MDDKKVAFDPNLTHCCAPKPTLHPLSDPLDVGVLDFLPKFPCGGALPVLHLQ